MTNIDSPADHRGEWLEFWERRQPSAFAALPYVMLVLASLLDVVVRGGLTDKALVDLALAAASALWMLWMADLHPAWAERRWLMTVFFAGLIGLMVAMVVRAPIFGFYTFTGYFWVFRVLRGRGRLAGVAAVAACSAISQSGGAPALTVSGLGTFVVIFVINAGVAGALAWFGWVGNEQKLRRQGAITELTETNRRLEESLHENAALHSQLLVGAREAGIAEERQRMAREIHDTLAQGLAGIITQLQATEPAEGDPATRNRRIQAAIGLARESLSEARRSVQALRPEPLEAARLPEALQDVAARWSALHGVPVTVTTTGAAHVMRPEIDVALLRTAQEALTNVAKHAQASRVGLTLSYMGDVVTLDVRDDGIGFRAAGELQSDQNASAQAGANGGFGLAAMRQRIQKVAGTLEIESEPDAGTAISASVPAVLAGSER